MQLFRRRAMIGAVLLSTLIGCTVEQVDGDATIFRYASWTPFAAFLAGIVAFAGGLALRPLNKRFGIVLLIMAPIVSFLFAPSLFRDRVVVRSQGFTLRTGFWFAPTRFDVSFRDLAGIEIVSESKRSRRGYSETNYFFLCEHKSGRVEKVPLGDLMRAGASRKIVETAKHEGIPVVERE